MMQEFRYTNQKDDFQFLNSKKKQNVYFRLGTVFSHLQDVLHDCVKGQVRMTMEVVKNNHEEPSLLLATAMSRRLNKKKSLTNSL